MPTPSRCRPPESPRAGATFGAVPGCSSGCTAAQSAWFSASDGGTLPTQARGRYSTETPLMEAARFAAAAALIRPGAARPRASARPRAAGPASGQRQRPHHLPQPRARRPVRTAGKEPQRNQVRLALPPFPAAVWPGLQLVSDVKQPAPAAGRGAVGCGRFMVLDRVEAICSRMFMGGSPLVTARSSRRRVR